MRHLGQFEMERGCRGSGGLTRIKIAPMNQLRDICRWARQYVLRAATPVGRLGESSSRVLRASIQDQHNNAAEHTKSFGCRGCCNVCIQRDASLAGWNCRDLDVCRCLAIEQRTLGVGRYRRTKIDANPPGSPLRNRWPACRRRANCHRGAVVFRAGLPKLASLNSQAAKRRNESPNLIRKNRPNPRHPRSIRSTSPLSNGRSSGQPITPPASSPGLLPES